MTGPGVTGREDRRRPTRTKPAKYSLMGLTVGQIEQISKALGGLPSNRWSEADPAVLIALVYAAYQGITPEEAKKMTMADLTDAVSLDEPDPTPPSA